MKQPAFLALPDDRGVSDPVVCDGLVLDTEIVHPFLSVGEPAGLSIRTCPAIRSYSIDDDNFSAESAVRVYANYSALQ
jgi:hypothetical protein